jgi:hypothetical protein
MIKQKLIVNSYEIEAIIKSGCESCGVVTGRGLFVPEHVWMAIDVYNNQLSDVGLTLEEYLTQTFVKK